MSNLKWKHSSVTFEEVMVWILYRYLEPVLHTHLTAPPRFRLSSLFRGAGGPTLAVILYTLQILKRRWGWKNHRISTHQPFDVDMSRVIRFLSATFRVSVSAEMTVFIVNANVQNVQVFRRDRRLHWSMSKIPSEYEDIGLFLDSGGNTGNVKFQLQSV